MAEGVGHVRIFPLRKEAISSILSCYALKFQYFVGGTGIAAAIIRRSI